MQAIIEFFQAAGVFLLFLAARFGLLLAVLAAIAVVFLAGLALVRVAGRIRQRALGLARVEGLTWRRQVAYSPGHSWLQVRGDQSVRVGLDDLAQHLLSCVTEVTLPEPGQALEAGQACATVRAGRRHAVIPAPVTGKVIAVNGRVRRNPSLLHSDPYASGWLYSIEPADASHTRLPRGDEARTWFGAEALRFSRFIEHELGMAAADGGELVAPGPTLLDDPQWKSMTRSFLRTPTT